MLGAILLVLMISPACSLRHGHPSDCHKGVAQVPRKTEPPLESAFCQTDACKNFSSRVRDMMDLSVDPCQDFYQYACGGWVRTQDIPPDRSSYDMATFVEDTAYQKLRDLVEEEERDGEPRAVRSAKHYYKTCSDEGDVEGEGVAPLSRVLGLYGGWPLLHPSPLPARTLEQLMSLSVRHNTGALFQPQVMPDARRPGHMALYITQPRWKMDVQTPGQRGAYRELVRGVAEQLAGESSSARTSSSLEADISLMIQFHLQLVTTADSSQQTEQTMYVKRTVGELSNIYPWVNWLVLLGGSMQGSSVGLTNSSTVVDSASRYLSRLGPLLNKTPIRVISNYVVWHFIESRMGTLPAAFRRLHQAYRQTVYGTQSARPRWRTCIRELTMFMPEVAGRIYVERHFREESKQHVQTDLQYLKEAFLQRLHRLTWLSPSTRTRAALKVARMVAKIGYPDEVYNNTYLDLSNQVTLTGHYFDDYSALLEMLMMKTMDSLNSAVDPSRWAMSPAVVNAYYDRYQNQIVVPGAILQPSYYYSGLPHYVNYGSTLAPIIGHEFTHGFDNQGRLFDSRGHMQQWWSTQDIRAFSLRAECFVKQFSDIFIPRANMSLQGRATLAENIADSGALRQAFHAYKNYVQDNGPERLLPGLNLTQEQIFFLSYAQVWCSKYSDEGLRWTIRADAHSPNMYRANVPCWNSPDFARVFQCPAQSSMNPTHSCTLW